MINDKIRQQLRDARKSAALTQAELAAGLLVSRPMVAQLESGAKEPSRELLERWCCLLGFEVVERQISIRRKK